MVEEFFAETVAIDRHERTLEVPRGVNRSRPIAPGQRRCLSRQCRGLSNGSTAAKAGGTDKMKAIKSRFDDTAWGHAAYRKRTKSPAAVGLVP